MVLSSNIVLATERTKGSRSRFVLESADFGRVMTQEGTCTKTLILAFISKTGQSVVHNRHGILLFGFFC